MAMKCGGHHGYLASISSYREVQEGIPLLMQRQDLRTQTIQRRHDKRAGDADLFQFGQDAFLGSGGNDEALLDKREIFLPRFGVEEEEAILVFVPDVSEIGPQHGQVLEREDIVLRRVENV